MIESILFMASEPWWVPAITGTAGTVVVLGILSKALWVELQKSRNEVSAITKESIEVITKLMTQSEDSQRTMGEVRTMLIKMMEHIKEDKEWKEVATKKIDAIVSSHEKQAR